MGKLIALGTGGNGGVGLAAANQFVEESAYVFVTGRRERGLAAAVKEIGKNATGVQRDVSDRVDLDRLFAQTKQEKRRLDALFANTGVAKYAPLGSTSEEVCDSTFKLQPRLDARRTGSMIQGSSLVGSCGFGLVEEICSWRAWITPCRNPASRTPVDQT
jgi:NAD(P)-dependent dehydrogenase (short-subunit alcohol dehydrogenase family)